MSLTKIAIAFCGAASTLALSIAASPPAFKKWTHADLKNLAPGFSELRQDQAVFASDLKHLRHDLHRGSSDARLTSDRRAAQADWTSVVADRYPNAPADSWLIELARRRSRAAPHAATRR